MAPKRPQMTLADYVVIAISPALIIALVGSLVFFLLEVSGAAQSGKPLNWIMFWFVMATVLIARVSIVEGAERAAIFGVALACAMMLHFLHAPLVGVGLLALVWWSANKLTWDCTLIDDKQDASGEGLLQVAGLDARGAPNGGQQAAGVGQSNETSPSAGWDEHEDGEAAGWWQRLIGQSGHGGKPHSPGLWVVYFSLAALPLFGLGQALVPADDVARRRYVFWLLCCYVASGLGLLLTTSFLGLRRYLRQRKLQMPKAMTGAWLSVGGVLILALLLAGALLPRPSPEYQLEDVLPESFSRSNRQASRYAVVNQRPGEGEGRPLAAPDAEGKPPEQDKPAGEKGASAGTGGSQTTDQRENDPNHEGNDPPDSTGAKGSGSGESAKQESGTGEQKGPGSKPGDGKEKRGRDQARQEQAGQEQGRSAKKSSEPMGAQSGRQERRGSSGRAPGEAKDQDSPQSGPVKPPDESPSETSDQKNQDQQQPQASKEKQQSDQRQSDQRQPSQTQSEQPQTGQPQSEQPQSDQPQSDQPQSDQPRADKPKSEQPGDTWQSEQAQQERPADQRQASSSSSGGQPERESPPDQQRPDEQSEPEKVQEQQAGQAAAAQSSGTRSWLPDVSQWSPAAWLRWIMYGVMALAAIYGLVRYHRQLAAFLKQMGQELLAIWQSLLNLFGARQRTATRGAEAVAAPAPRPFAAFEDPFQSGAARRWKPDQLVRYSFEALQAWAAERDAARHPDQTPLEFARQLARAAPSLSTEVRELAELYVQAAYARGSLTGDCRPIVQRFWQRLAWAGNAGRLGTAGLARGE